MKTHSSHSYMNIVRSIIITPFDFPFPSAILAISMLVPLRPFQQFVSFCYEIENFTFINSVSVRSRYTNTATPIHH